MKPVKWITLFAGIMLLISLSACGGAKTVPGTASDMGVNAVKKTLSFLIDDKEVTVEWEDNQSVSALIDLAKTEPLIIKMSMYGGFEQVGPLGTSLPRNDAQTTTAAGDIVLYSGNQIVIFYGSNSWAYTRLGRITDKTAAEMADLLGKGRVTITISCEGR